MIWGDHDLERIWQRILLAEVTDLGEPRVLKAVVEDINPMLVEDVGWAQDCYHVEEGILVFVDQGRSRGDPDRKWRAGAGVQGLDAGVSGGLFFCGETTHSSLQGKAEERQGH